jgi:hypothetical protein
MIRPQLDTLRDVDRPPSAAAESTSLGQRALGEGSRTTLNTKLRAKFWTLCGPVEVRPPFSGEESKPRMQPSSSKHSILLGLFFDSEDGGLRSSTNRR